MTRLALLSLLIALAAKPCSMAQVRQLWAKVPHAETDLFAFEQNGKVGFINSQGKVVVSPSIVARIEKVGDFEGGRASVEGLGFIDTRGNSIPPAQDLDQRLAPFHEGLSPFQISGKPSVRRLKPFDLVYLDFPGLFGFIDQTSRLVIEPRFAEAGPFNGGLARVALDGFCQLSTPENHWQGNPTTGYPNRCAGAPEDALSTCNVGFIDRAGLAAVKIAGKWGYVDGARTLVIEPEYSDAQPFSNSLALVNGTSKPVYIGRTGKVKLAGPFFEATPFSHGLAAVLLSKRRVAYIDTEGRRIFEYWRAVQ